MIRPWLAVVGFFAVGLGIVVAAGAVARLVQPGSELDRRGRIPPTAQRVTGWARSRSLRLWCPDTELHATACLLLATPFGMRLRRLGVSVVESPRFADVVVTRDAADLDELRKLTPVPCASIVVEDLGELGNSIVALSAALRWQADP